MRFTADIQASQNVFKAELFYANPQFLGCGSWGIYRANHDRHALWPLHLVTLGARLPSHVCTVNGYCFAPPSSSDLPEPPTVSDDGSGDSSSSDDSSDDSSCDDSSDDHRHEKHHHNHDKKHHHNHDNKHNKHNKRGRGSH